MRRWFLSYHSPDQALAERLKLALEAKDSGAHVFFAPQHMRAGGFWTAQLAQELADANAFILLIGEHGLGKWQVPEYDEALDRRVQSTGFPLIVMLLEGQTAPGLPFLRRLHWIVTPDPASEKDIARLIDAAAGADIQPGELWRHASPYRGLMAMEEKDADYFFGRERETVEVLNTLAADGDRLPVLLGNSGVGKSSLAQAGVLAALKRQAWPERANVATAWPRAFSDSRRWCFLSLRPGTEPLRALVDTFLDTWQFGATDAMRVEQQNAWIALLRDGKASLRDLLDTTARRYDELQQPKPAVFFFYVDQGEELYVRSEESQRRRFSALLAEGLRDPRLRALMSLRSDFLGALQGDEPLFNARHQIDVPPLREAELRAVVSRPAELLGARFETDHLATDIAARAAAESVKDAGALPLLSYLLDDMWTQMVERGDGTLRLPAASIDLGRVLAERADAFLARNPKSEDALRRVLTLKLATVREDGEPTRRRAPRSEFSDEEWRLVSELADHPNRLLVTATPAGGETYAEVAHEAIFKRWERLQEWIAAEREFLAWKTGLEAARRAWQATPDATKSDALLMGFALTQAQGWLAKRGADIPRGDRDFIVLSRDMMRRQRLRLQALVGVLVAALLAGVAGWRNEQWLKDNWYWFTSVSGHVNTAAKVLALPLRQPFRDCLSCPEMIVVPAGVFIMGSPPREPGRYHDKEGPQRKVTIPQPFAVGRFEVTFAEWDACVARGDCPSGIADRGWGRARQPVINVTWHDARRYAAWLSRITGQRYRLLTEAEWEYAARAGSATAYPWGDEIGKGNANCDGCGSQWDGIQAAPVGSFTPNAFGLHDMHGNVWEWVEDCAGRYDAAPSDGSAEIRDCESWRVIRGGSWKFYPRNVRSAGRDWDTAGSLSDSVGFRVARTLLTP